MNLLLPLLLLTLLAAPTGAQPGDPLKSPACGDAVAALEAARAAKSGNVERLRQAAASRCLGTAQPPQRTGRFAQPPIIVPPPVIVPPARPAQLAPVAPLPPPVALPRAALPAHCDAGGCWVNDGTHLRHLPPAPGLCTPHGGLVYCP